MYYIVSPSVNVYLQVCTFVLELSLYKNMFTRAITELQEMNE